MLAVTVVNRPICPDLIKDENVGIIVCILGIAAGIYVLCRVMHYFNST